MSEVDKMRLARRLIVEKRYAEARALLKTTDHPSALEWLHRLDQIAPPDSLTTYQAPTLAIDRDALARANAADAAQTAANPMPHVAPQMTPQPAPVQVPSVQTPPVKRRRWWVALLPYLFGFLGGLIGAAVGVAVWVAINIFAGGVLRQLNIETGFLAILVGVDVAFGVLLFSWRKRSFVLMLLAALITVIGVLAAKYTIRVWGSPVSVALHPDMIRMVTQSIQVSYQNSREGLWLLLAALTAFGITWNRSKSR